MNTHRPGVVGLATLLALSFILIPACLPGGGGGLFWNPIDEDFSRPSPQPAVQGALRRACSDTTPPDQHFQTEVAFEHALCLCGDLENVGQGLLTRSRSYALGNDGGFAHVGVNGAISVVGHFDIDGDLNVARGIDGVGDLGVEGNLLCGNDVDVVGNWNVNGDAWIDGDLSGVGSIDINGDLYLTGDLSAVGNVSYGDGHKGFTYAGQPCGCGANQLIDVPAEIARHKADNDNDRIPGGIGSDSLVLDSGDYYFDDPADFVGARSITVRGRVAVYVDGDLSTVGNLNIDVQPGAELALWVTGRVETVGNLKLAAGDSDRPRAFKLFMGGRGSSIVNVGNATFIGSIYAPEVDIEYVGNLEVQGSLFANNLSGTGNLTVTYDTDVAAPPACVDEHYQVQND